MPAREHVRHSGRWAGTGRRLFAADGGAHALGDLPAVRLQGARRG